MKPRRPMSLAARLALLFAAVSAAVFALAGVHLYHSLSEQFQRHEDIGLLGTLAMVRHQLSSRGGVDTMHAVINLLQAAYGPRAVIAAVRDGRGAILAATTQRAQALPLDDVLPPEETPDLGDIRDWTDGGRTIGRYISAWQRTEDPAMPEVLVTIARVDAASGVALDAHGREGLLTLAAGVLATGLIGYGISRRALRPVRALARTAEDVTGSRLGSRLDPEHAPRELRDMVDAFNHMLDRLEESFRRLTRFSSDIAHDLQTPLGNLMGQTQVALSRRRTVDEYEALLASNVEEFERLSRMIRDMLFLAKADNPETVIEHEPVDLRRELDKIADYYDTLADDGRPCIVVRGTGVVMGDKLLIQRAMQNLISNALRFSDGEPVHAAIASDADGYTDIEISNTGPGIAPEHQPYVFDRFYRADSARTRSSEGSGLGLAIVKSIAELHGGSVLLNSEPGGTTTFTLHLPHRPT